MIRVKFPDLDYVDAFSTCLSSVGEGDEDIQYKNRLINVSDVVTREWMKFSALISPMHFHFFKSCPSSLDTFVVAGNATKGDFTRLYSTYMVKGRKDSRWIYNKLRASSHGLCPLCGIGKVYTLDHHLPKAHYPILSVYPWNLIPACRDCNTIKSDPKYTKPSELPLYPYRDNLKFYNTNWIKAVIEKKYGVLNFHFSVNPPSKWLEVEKKRVISHFYCYDIAAKYNLNAAQYVSVVKSEITRILNNGDDNDVRKHFLGLVPDVPPNSTLRVMYQAIADDSDVCSGNF